MDILILLVIAMFVISGAYVGYHAMQQPVEEGEGYGISTELKILDKKLGTIQVFQESDLNKSII